jgi:hypothetical protein
MPHVPFASLTRRVRSHFCRSWQREASYSRQQQRHLSQLCSFEEEGASSFPNLACHPRFAPEAMRVFFLVWGSHTPRPNTHNQNGSWYRKRLQPGRQPDPGSSGVPGVGSRCGSACANTAGLDGRHEVRQKQPRALPKEATYCLPKERHRLVRMHLAAALLMHVKRCNFRPPGPFGITLRAGWVMDGAAGLSPHCHWPSRTIYGTSRRVASCWA